MGASAAAPAAFDNILALLALGAFVALLVAVHRRFGAERLRVLTR